MILFDVVSTDEGWEGSFRLREHAEGYVRELRETMGVRAVIVRRVESDPLTTRIPS